MPFPPSFQLRRPPRGHGLRSAPGSHVAALMLVAAAYDFDVPFVDLQFDRAISIAGLSPGAIVVDDGSALAEKMGGTSGATLLNPTTVRVPLVPVGESTTSQVVLTATASSGIVAADDGGTWAGVTDLVLPFP